MRQTEGGVCRHSTLIARCAFPEEGSVEKSLRYRARYSLTLMLLALPVPAVSTRHSEEGPSFSIEIVDARKNLSCQ